MSKRRGRLGHRPWWAKLNLPLVAAAVATVLAVLLYAGDRKGWWQVPGLRGFELTSIDARFQLRGARTPESDDIVILGLDDRTRTEAPEVFQTRRGWAELLEALTRYQPRAVGLDLFFSSPELAVSPELVAQVREADEALKQETDLSPAATKALAALDAVIAETLGDARLAKAITASGRIFLGVMFFLPEGEEKPAPPGIREPAAIAGARFGEAVDVPQPPSLRPPAAVHVARTLPEIGSGAAGAGALNVLKDPDGDVRQVYGAIEYGGRFYMPLGMVMALRELGDGADASFVVGARHIRVGQHEVPVGPRGEVSLSFLGPRQTFPHVSAADVLSGAAPRESLADKLVFVGFTDAARDKVSTPFERQLDGVEIHAILAYNILHDQAMRHAAPMSTLLTILLLGVALTVLQLRRVRQRRAWVAAAGALVILAGYLVVAQILFSRGLVIEVAAPLAAILFITLASLSVALATEGREKAQLRTAFSQYVNDTIVDRITRDQELARLGGERRELTVLFSDIRGFSRFSEKLEPEVLSDYLNEYLTPMTTLVMNEDGMLDKYIGDAVMAVYGAPIDMTDHAERACRTALSMLAALEPLNQRWRKVGLPEIAIGIGLNSGPMAVGNMGSEAKFDYTVMGDAVNLGARLEGLTKEYQVEVLVGEQTALAAAARFGFRELDLVQVKGREGTARIFELLGPRDSVPFSEAELADFHAALEAYRRRDWDQAEAGFQRFLAAHPDDGPSQVMLRRITNLRADPPGEDWDGVFTQVTK